jgi:tetratricopeptide (TPR) repeat protein
MGDLGGGSAIASIQGMGGIGKTELALQYALHHYSQGTYPGGVCWLRARDQQIGTQILAFAQLKLGLTLPEEPDLVALVQWCWDHWCGGDVLVAIDDVTDLSAIRDYLPPTTDRRFRVLLTTRSHFGSPIRELDLAVLEPEAALALLRSLVADGRVENQRSDAETLCKWLGYLPLGVELVGRYLARERDLSLKAMLDCLQDEQLQQEALLLEPDAAQRLSTAERGIAKAFELSWEKLGAAAQQLGCLLSVLGLAPIPWQLVEQVQKTGITQASQPPTGWRKLLPWGKRQRQAKVWEISTAKILKQARANLGQWSLLQRIDQDLYQLHPLIGQFFAAKLNAQADASALRGAVAAIAANIASEIPSSPTLEDIAKVTLTIPHLENVATYQREALTDDDLSWIFTGIARFYGGQGIYAQAEPWYQGCLTATKERLGDRHPAVATSLNNLTELYRVQGRYETAELLYLEALQLYKDLLGDRHPAVATSLNNLALLYDNQGRYEAAEPLYIEALQLRKDLLGDRHPDVAFSLNNLAGLYKSQGRYEAAEPLYLEALQLYKDLLGDRHPAVATSLNNLALLYESQGRYEAAEPLYVEALQLFKELLGDRHPDVASSLNNLASLYYAQGRYQEAEPFFVETVQRFADLLGENHPNSKIVRQNFEIFLREARCFADTARVDQHRTAELSEHPLTQILLQQLRTP